MADYAAGCVVEAAVGGSDAAQIETDEQGDGCGQGELGGSTAARTIVVGTCAVGRYVEVEGSDVRDGGVQTHVIWL